MYKLSKTNRTVYLSSLFLYNFARVLPHAILTVILLNKGLTVSQIAIVQSFYMLATTMFEFPSGFLTDIWSEKIMYQLSLILIGVSYFIYKQLLPTLLVMVYLWHECSFYEWFS